MNQRAHFLFVRPDYFSGRPKPCMGGWGRLAMVVDPRKTEVLERQVAKLLHRLVDLDLPAPDLFQ